MKRIVISLLCLVILGMMPGRGTAQSGTVSSEIKQAFPTATRTVTQKAWTEVYVSGKKPIGYVAYSKPHSDGIEGFAGETPLMVVFNKSRHIDHVVMLPNGETPGFVQRVVQAGLLDAWNGLSVKEALQTKADAVSGATYTSRSVIRSMDACLSALSAAGFAAASHNVLPFILILAGLILVAAAVYIVRRSSRSRLAASTVNG